MKLTSAQVERTLSQFEAQPVPDSHPMVPQLNEIVRRSHFLSQPQWTDFLNRNGLNIVEPTAQIPRAGAQVARVVNLANWSDAKLTSLTPHEPELTDATVDLGSKH